MGIKPHLLRTICDRSDVDTKVNSLEASLIFSMADLPGFSMKQGIQHTA